MVWTVRRAGAASVIDGVRHVGAGIIVICVLASARALIRTAGWRMCLDPDTAPGFAAMFAAYLSGDAIGNVTPFGFLISEPAKVVLVRRRVDVASAAVALTIENLFYSATVVVMLAAGTAALLSFAVPPSIRIASLATLATAAVLMALVTWIISTRRRVVSGAIEWLIRHNVAAVFWQARLPKIRQSGDRIFDFAARRPTTVLPLLALESSYHVVAVGEIWLSLLFITGAPPPLLTAFVLEYVNRTITVAFQFVPMWLGVDEASSSLAAGVLGIGAPVGVSLALVRKTRLAIWTGVGIAVLLMRGLSVGGAAHDAEVLAERQGLD